MISRRNLFKGHPIMTYRALTVDDESAASSLPLLAVKNGDVISLLPMESIVWICAEGKYTIIATKEKRYICNYSITELEERLGAPFFLRVHRSYIVNLKHIVELRKIGAGKMKLITKTLPDEDIVVSKNYYDNLKERLVLD
jgi:DNA-binding LytR/AlgR family response regulator